MERPGYANRIQTTLNSGYFWYKHCVWNRCQPSLSHTWGRPWFQSGWSAVTTEPSADQQTHEPITCNSHPRSVSSTKTINTLGHFRGVGSHPALNNGTSRAKLNF